jgi:sterol desaturase/sphingolipid hydroxylase (fatty acid hydroxylase superfamily)
MFLFHIRGTIVFGLVTGFFYFFFENQLEVIEILGVNIGRFIFLFVGANLRHSHVPLFYSRWLEHIFISPVQHQIHHSLEPSDYNKNMGSHLAIWDLLFGTLKVSDKEKLEYVFGIPKAKNENFNNWFKVLYLPVIKGFKSFCKSSNK